MNFFECFLILLKLRCTWLPDLPFYQLNVRREQLIADTLRQLQEYENTPHVLKKPLKVTFAGEEGYDAGGVKKELFLLLMKELLSPNYGMFTVDPEVIFELTRF